LKSCGGQRDSTSQVSVPWSKAVFFLLPPTDPQTDWTNVLLQASAPWISRLWLDHQRKGTKGAWNQVYWLKS
jgi:hypothetical protein